MLCPHVSTVAPPVRVHLEQKLEVGGKIGRGWAWLERMTLEIIAVPWGAPGRGSMVKLVYSMHMTNYIETFCNGIGKGKHGGTST